jgi:anti-anti-sigma factor
MAAETPVFEIGQEGETLLVTPTEDLRELEYRGIDAAGAEVVGRLQDGRVKHVVVDWSRADYCGSTGLGFFAGLWARLRRRGGRLAFCNVSDHLREILRVVRFEELWPIYPTRAEALRAVIQSD